MAVLHDDVGNKDFQCEEASESYFYPCPRGDNFCISLCMAKTVLAPSTNKELVKC
ncbi:diphthamide biosynthesis protein 3-like [Tenrec ecaudatus]|uniref:diphthamide biosynthesis protein 3-like n=1 Tax=Tenrec ecaudatus TaxID=94439 RepID=UPI003F591D61